MKRVSTLLGCALLIDSTVSTAQQHESCAAAPQLGTWALQSFVTQDLQTGRKTYLFGEHPSGYLSYGPDCRMYAILIKDNRKPPTALVPTDAEKVELFGGMIAYAGAYTTDGDKVSHHIDASWNQAWTGTTQVREFKIDGNTLHIRTAPSKSPVTGNQSVSSLVWTKLR